MGASECRASGKEPVQGEGSPSGGENAVQSCRRQHGWAQPPRHSLPGRHHQRDHGSEMTFKFITLTFSLDFFLREI